MLWLYMLALIRAASSTPPPSVCTAPDILTYSWLCPLEHYDLSFFDNATIGDSVSHARDSQIDPICYETGPDSYCTYTDVHFNDGEGLSLIATAEGIAYITNRTAFQSRIPVPKVNARYRDVEVPGKGRGLVATEAIQAGRTLITRTPAIVVNTNAVKNLKVDELDEMLVRAVEDLSPAHRDEILELSAHDGAKTYREKVGKIFRTNSFSTGFHDGKSGFQSLFATVSRINHSCRPNCAYFFDTATFSQHVVAARDIEPGEELSVAYIDPILARSERNKKLKAWGFECSCERCAAEPEDSDDNVVEIQRLWKVLDDYSMASLATPTMAERLVSLYEKEGLESRLQEAYYRAAVEWLGVGEIGKASEYAGLCVQFGTLFKGADRPFIVKMRQLLENPTNHPHWMFRLKNENKN